METDTGIHTFETTAMPFREALGREARLRTLSLIASLTLLAACGAVRDGEVRRARLAAERRTLEATLDRLEDRLLVDQARVRFWREMRTRHESVTAIACASQEQHAEEMARHLLAPPARREARHTPVHQSRVATRAVAAPEPTPTIATGAAN